jgi:purine-binding chemotaxis protein CheW
VDLAKIRKKARQEGAKAAPEKPQPTPAAKPQPPAPEPPPTPKRKREAAAEAPVAPPPPERVPEVLEEYVYTPATEPQEIPVPQEDAATITGKGERLLIFTLERERYAIPIHDIALIIQGTTITPIPNAPDFLLGILSLRGKVVSILDAAKRLQLVRREAVQEGKIIVLDMGTDQFGLLVDGIEQLVEVDISSLEPPPEGFTPLPQDFVEGVFHHKGRAVGFLNLPMFLSFQI